LDESKSAEPAEIAFDVADSGLLGDARGLQGGNPPESRTAKLSDSMEIAVRVLRSWRLLAAWR
jgi:hypothetical protein